MSPTPTATIAAIAPELLSKAKTAGGKVLDSMNNEVLSVALNDDLEWVSVEDPAAVFKLRLTPGLILAAGGVGAIILAFRALKEGQFDINWPGITPGAGAPTPGSLGLFGVMGIVANLLGLKI